MRGQDHDVSVIDRIIPTADILIRATPERIADSAELVLGIGVDVVENPAALGRCRAARADVQGEPMHVPRDLDADRHEFRRAHVRHAKGVTGGPWDGATGAAHGRAVVVRRCLYRFPTV